MPAADLAGEAWLAARRSRLEELLPPPLLRVHPRGPVLRPGFDAVLGQLGVVATLPARIGRQRADGALEPDAAVAVRLRRAAERDDRIHFCRMARRPLKRLLRAHRETDDRAQMLDAQAVHHLA